MKKISDFYRTKVKDLSNLFTGPTAVAFGEDAIMSARILSKNVTEVIKLISAMPGQATALL